MRPLRHFSPTTTTPILTSTPEGNFAGSLRRRSRGVPGLQSAFLGWRLAAQIADRRGGGLHRPWLWKYNSDEISHSQAWDHLRFRGMTSSERCVILKPSDIMKNESERRPAAPR